MRLTLFTYFSEPASRDGEPMRTKGITTGWFPFTFLASSYLLVFTHFSEPAKSASAMGNQGVWRKNEGKAPTGECGSLWTLQCGRLFRIRPTQKLFLIHYLIQYSVWDGSFCSVLTSVALRLGWANYQLSDDDILLVLTYAAWGFYTAHQCSQV